MPGENEARGLLGSLANPARVRLYARIVVAAEGDDPLAEANFSARESRALGALIGSGLVSLREGLVIPNLSRFAEALAEQPAIKKPGGPERFLVNGVLERLPVKACARQEVLEWLAGKSAAAGEQLTEHEVTQRLGVIAADPAEMRRQLVDAGFLERANDGSSYWRPAR